MTSHNWGNRSGDRPGIGGPGYTAFKRSVWARDNGLCQHVRYDTGLPCYDPGDAVDHIVPVSQGGKSVPSNGQVLCRYHHAQKTGQEAAEGRRKAKAARRAPRKQEHPSRPSVQDLHARFMAESQTGTRGDLK
ncbi:HNH endonuclease signature motif containing protein [Streptomyces sp. NPDC050095]|uniref:HNH endonuclease n=1 Tax=unclassified Streptomyces TaxID=2593676 RepID=UPI0034367CE3